MSITLTSILVTLLVGLVIGFIAKAIMGGAISTVWTIILGLAGSLIGGLLFNLIGLSTYGWPGQIVAGVVGACIVLFAARRLA